MKIIEIDYDYAFRDIYFLRKMQIADLVSKLCIMHSSVLPILKRETIIDHYSRLNLLDYIKNSITRDNWLSTIEIHISFEFDEELIRIFLLKCL
jgi:hypothetical protein